MGFNIGLALFAKPTAENIRKLSSRSNLNDVYYLFGGVFRVTHAGFERVLDLESIPAPIRTSSLYYSTTGETFEQDLKEHDINLRTIDYIPIPEGEKKIAEFERVRPAKVRFQAIEKWYSSLK